MVAIKIQNAEDIIKAYLQSLGFTADVNSRKFIEAYPSLLKAEDVVAELNEIISGCAAKFLGQKSASEHLSAAFRYLFITLSLAQKYGVESLLPDFNNQQLFAELRQERFESAPAYCWSDVPVQTIEPLSFHKHI